MPLRHSKGPLVPGPERTWSNANEHARELCPFRRGADDPNGAGPIRLALLRATRLAAWLRAWADYLAAAAAYEDLSRLSDTQLKHRGLSRDILARDVSQANDQGSGT